MYSIFTHTIHLSPFFKTIISAFLLNLSLYSCKFGQVNDAVKLTIETNAISLVNSKETTLYKQKKYDTAKVIHLMVALCDNTYQGIVPVNKTLGNGQNPTTNLYWGAAYGVKTYFKKSKKWAFIESIKKDSVLLERLIFKHNKKNFYLIADAYNGKNIKEATDVFLESATGMKKQDITVKESVLLKSHGGANLISYIGHNGLMDFTLAKKYKNKDSIQRDIIILACYSKNYFSNYLDSNAVNPLVWSTGLMAPEAYIIHDALTSYVNGGNNEEINSKAAMAYSKYQKCSINAAKRLLVNGW